MKEEKAKAKNITVSKRVMDLAQQIMDVRRFDDFSGMVQQLIREEWERRYGPMKATTGSTLPPSPPPLPSPSEPLSAKRKRNRPSLKHEQQQ